MRGKLLSLIALVSMPLSALGQDGPCSSPEAAKAQEEAVLSARGYDTALIAARMCLGSPRGDGSPVVAAFNSKTPDAADWPTRRQHLRAALEELEAYAKVRAVTAPNRAEWLIVQGRLEQEIQLVDTLESVDSGAAVFLDDRFWLQDARPGTPVANGAIELLAPTQCAAPPADCANYEPRKDLIRVFNLVRRLGDYADYTKVNAQLEDAKLQNSRWKAYFNDARPQFWWEVILNGRAMDKKHCRKDPATGIELGYCTVPSSQWIFLHPAAALQWADGADGENELKPAFIVEVFGRNSWNWQGGSAARQRGWSLLAAYSDRGAEQKKWSYGVMLTYGKDLNLGITTADDEIGILVSTRLAARYFEKKQEYMNYLKAKDKPDWTALIN